MNRPTNRAIDATYTLNIEGEIERSVRESQVHDGRNEVRAKTTVRTPAAGITIIEISDGAVNRKNKI
jgi:hypothetical protein